MYEVPPVALMIGLSAAVGGRTPRVEAMWAGLSNGEAARMAGTRFRVLAGPAAAVLTWGSGGGPDSPAVRGEPRPPHATHSATVGVAIERMIRRTRRPPCLRHISLANQVTGRLADTYQIVDRQAPRC